MNKPTKKSSTFNFSKQFNSLDDVGRSLVLGVIEGLKTSLFGKTAPAKQTKQTPHQKAWATRRANATTKFGVSFASPTSKTTKLTPHQKAWATRRKNSKNR